MAVVPLISRVTPTPAPYNLIAHPTHILYLADQVDPWEFFMLCRHICFFDESLVVDCGFRCIGVPKPHLQLRSVEQSFAVVVALVPFCLCWAKNGPFIKFSVFVNHMQHLVSYWGYLVYLAPSTMYICAHEHMNVHTHCAYRTYRTNCHYST